MENVLLTPDTRHPAPGTRHLTPGTRIQNFLVHSILHWLGRFWLRLFGWKIHGIDPSCPKFVCVAAPHTSNWDLPFMLATAFALRARTSWLGKDSIFRPPLGLLLRALGGIPVDRRSPQSLVMQMAEEFRKRESLVLAISPEGTRKKVEYWKSGFYRIALQSQVPIGLGYLDFEKRRCGLGMLMTPTGNIQEDMDTIRAFYLDIKGKYPQLQSRPQLREETSQ